MIINIGTTFTHKRFLHPEDRHLPVKQARKAEMVVTSANKSRVYYTYSGSEATGGRWWMPREYFEETYAESNS